MQWASVSGGTSANTCGEVARGTARVSSAGVSELQVPVPVRRTGGLFGGGRRVRVSRGQEPGRRGHEAGEWMQLRPQEGMGSRGPAATEKWED